MIYSYSVSVKANELQVCLLRLYIMFSLLTVFFLWMSTVDSIYLV